MGSLGAGHGHVDEAPEPGIYGLLPLHGSIFRVRRMGGAIAAKAAGDYGVHARKQTLAGVSLRRQDHPARSPLTRVARQGYWAVP